MPRQRCETEVTQIYCRAIWVWGTERSCEQLQLVRTDAVVNGRAVGFATEGPQNLSSPLTESGLVLLLFLPP